MVFEYDEKKLSRSEGFDTGRCQNYIQSGKIQRESKLHGRSLLTFLVPWQFMSSMYCSKT